MDHCSKGAILEGGELISVDVATLARLNRSVPRYTSYPTAPQFQQLDASIYLEKLKKFDASDKPLSIYIHIPFCQRMCLFCGCSVILNRNPETQRTYLNHLLQEIKQLPFSQKRLVTQLHIGGGTPTSLSIQELQMLMQALREKFELKDDGEISIEIDPRTVYADGGEKLRAIRELGFNRVSFGVQDLDPTVQEAVRRRQSEQMTVVTYKLARVLGFEGINLDLIYGLPFQTPESFAKTAAKILELKPDRIALFSYAKVPWIKAHQKAIKEETLPSTEDKFTIYASAREMFMKGGYTALGMDHFALPEDPIAEAYLSKKLTRNFQGYALDLAEDMIGLGVTAIGFLENAYFQNIGDLETYQNEVSKGHLPLHRGYLLKPDDLIRRWVIQTVMCRFELCKKEFFQKFEIDFDVYFQKETPELEKLVSEGLLEITKERLSATQLGRLFIRLIAAVFDAYLEKGQYSKAV